MSVTGIGSGPGRALVALYGLFAVAAGARAVLVYVIQMQADRFDVARDIDPAYDAAFAAARAAGVVSYAYACRVTPDEITIAEEVEIVTPLARVAAPARAV